MMVNYIYGKASIIFLSIILVLELFSPNSVNAAISGSYTNLNNQSVPYSTFDGRLLFVEIFQTTCPACVDQHPELVKFYNEFKEHVVMLSLSVRLADTIEVINQFLEEHPASWSFGIDKSSSFATQFHIDSTPTMIFFDRAGNELITKEGFTSYEELASNMNYYLSVLNPISAPSPTYDGGGENSGSVIEDLFSSQIFSIGFFSIIVIMIYLKMTGSTNLGT